MNLRNILLAGALGAAVAAGAVAPRCRTGLRRHLRSDGSAGADLRDRSGGTRTELLLGRRDIGAGTDIATFGRTDTMPPRRTPARSGTPDIGRTIDTAGVGAPVIGDARTNRITSHRPLRCRGWAMPISALNPRRYATPAHAGFGRRRSLFRRRRFELAVGRDRGGGRSELDIGLADRRFCDVRADRDCSRLSLVASSRRRRHVRMEQARLRAVCRIHHRLDVLGEQSSLLSGAALLRGRQRALHRREPARVRSRPRPPTSSPLR